MASLNSQQMNEHPGLMPRISHEVRWDVFVGWDETSRKKKKNSTFTRLINHDNDVKCA